MNLKQYVFYAILMTCLQASPNPRKAIIVGASTGIGRELAKILAANGYELGLCSRKLDLLETLQQELPTKSYIKELDLKKTASIKPCLHSLIKSLGGLDLMIVNSGIWPEADHESMPRDRIIPIQPISDTITVNVLGCATAFNVAANYFLKQNYGHIVGISSIAAQRSSAGMPAYCGSKAFMHLYLEGLRYKFTQKLIPIDITEIQPGFISSENAKGAETQYWAVTPAIAAKDTYESIVKRHTLAYVPRRWRLIAWLYKITPDWLYNALGEF